MSVLLSNGSLIHYEGESPKIGYEVTAVLKNADGSIEMLRAEVLAIWEVE